MADKEIATLTAAGTLDGTELFVVTDTDGNSRKLTLSDLKTFVNTDPTVVPSSEPFRGALAYRSSTVALANNTAVQISWNAEQYDTDSIWDVGAPTRLTVPSGVTKVRLATYISLPVATYTLVQVNIIKNGDTGFLAYPGSGMTRIGVASSTSTVFGANSGVVEVTAGDYFEVRTAQVSGSSQDIQINSWFSMEIVEG